MSDTLAALTWPVGDWQVRYRPELDGAGSRIAPAFADCVAALATRPVYEHAFEWCAGPGFIGFTLLRRGLVRRLTLCDVNPAAIACVAATVEAHGLADRVRYAVGPDLTPLGPDDRFDLVVANPPNFYALNPRHPRYPALRDDLRPNDPGWRVHRAFYRGIAGHLTADAQLFVSEVNPHQARVFIPPEEAEPYDIRPRPAAEDLSALARAGGLAVQGFVPFFTGTDGAELEMMVSRPRAGAAR